MALARPSLFPSTWTALTPDQANRLLVRLDDHMAKAGLPSPPFSEQANISDLCWAPISFYGNWLAITGTAHLKRGLKGYFDVLLSPNGIVCLDGQSNIIHEINDIVLLSKQVEQIGTADSSQKRTPSLGLNPTGTGPDYLRFFCHSVRSNIGMFRVIESTDDLVSAGIATATAKKLSKKLLPLTMRKKPDALTAQATILYRGSLFSTDMEVSQTGAVQMLEDTAIANDIAPQDINFRWLRNLNKPIAESNDENRLPVAARQD